MLILAGFNANGLVCAFLMRPFNDKVEKKPFKGELKKMLKALTCSYDSVSTNRRTAFGFYVMSASLTTIGSKALMNYTHLTLSLQGYTREQSTNFVSILGSFLIVSFLFGAFSDLQFVNRLIMMTFSNCLSGVIIIIIPFHAFLTSSGICFPSSSIFLPISSSRLSCQSEMQGKK